MAKKPKQAENNEKPSFQGILEKEKAALERGMAALDACIAKVESMLGKAGDGDEYDDRLASHLAWLIKGRADSVAKLRAFHEKVKTQSLELSDEQRIRAVAKFIQTLPVTRRDYFKSLLDDDIPDIELVS